MNSIIPNNNNIEKFNITIDIFFSVNLIFVNLKTTGNSSRMIEKNFFIDVQAKGKYSNYALKKFEKEGIKLDIQERDMELLKEHTVDFVSFSYYSSKVAS